MIYTINSNDSEMMRPDAAGARKGRKGRRPSGFAVALLVALFSAPMATAGPVAPSAPVNLAAETMEERVARLPQGEVFENNGFSYVLLPTLRGETQQGDRAPFAVGEGQSVEEEFARKGPFRIIRQAAVLSPATGGDAAGFRGAGLLHDPPLHPVVFSGRLQRLGVMTRNLWLKLADMKECDAIAREYGLNPSYVSAPMQTAFYSAPAGIDLMQLRARLRKDPRILRVTLEIQERFPRPR